MQPVLRNKRGRFRHRMMHPIISLSIEYNRYRTVVLDCMRASEWAFQSVQFPEPLYLINRINPDYPTHFEQD
ncbi:MAG: hypothetical protein KAI83_00655 [Thiomargarita sp.]|nr:hypothetical protein [Thiomargarita sp.]